FVGLAEPAAPSPRRTFVCELASLARRANGLSTRRQYADQFGRVHKNRYSQGDDSRRGKTHRRREVYSVRQAGVYGYGGGLRNTRSRAGPIRKGVMNGGSTR